MKEHFLCIDKYVEQRRREARNPSMVIALYDRQKTVRVSAYGVTDLGSQTPITPQTLFEIGSISKTFGAVVALQAYEAGLLDLYAPVTEYLPWFEVRSRYGPILIHHLLSHSSGLPYSADFAPDALPIVWGLRHIETGFAPGTHYAYSEPGYQTLTLVLEKVCGKSYAEIVQQGILDPLEMSSTVAAITHDTRRCLPQGYRTLYDDRPSHSSHPLVPADWLEFSSADGSIASTAEDMARFGRMLLNRGRGPNGPILSADTLDLMMASKVEGSSYGYGLYVFEEDGCVHIGHSGDMPGYEAGMWMDLDSGLGEVLLSTQPYPMGVVWKVLDFWRAAGLGRSLSQVPPPVDPLSVDNAVDYAGVYRAGDKTLEFVADQDRLWVNLDGKKVAAEKRGDDSFYINHPGFDLYLVQFDRARDTEDDPGPVVELAYGPHWYVNERYAGPA